MIKFIVFDVMGVVFTVGDDVEGLLIPYVRSRKPDIDPRYIKEKYLDASLGYISSLELWALMGFSVEEIPAVERDYLESSFTLDPCFLPCVKALKSRYDIALLSNDVAEWSKFLREYYHIEPLLKGAFISGDLGVRKPAREIYTIMLNSLGAKPGQCLFLDDDPVRVDAACELGISSILFNRDGHGYRGLQVKSFEQLLCLL